MFDEAIKLAAQLMAISAKTAPKTSGLDYLEIKIIVGEDLVKLGEAMTRYGSERRSLVPESKGKNVTYTADYLEQAYARDGENVKNATALLLIGLRKGSASADSNCGGCGVELCAQRRVKKGAEFDGPQCGFRLLDMGIAIGSAVKTASILNIDNRVFGTAGTVAKRIGMVDWDWVVGIALSAAGKNIFVDRPTINV
jgi:uncharacterized ferredoxin-like protein